MKLLGAVLLTSLFFISCGDKNLATQKDLDVVKSDIQSSTLCLQGPLSISVYKKGTGFEFSKMYDSNSKTNSGGVGGSTTYTATGVTVSGMAGHFGAALNACAGVKESYNKPDYSKFKVEYIYSTEDKSNDGTVIGIAQSTWNCYAPCP